MGEITLFIALSLTFFGSAVRAIEEPIIACEKLFSFEYADEGCCESIQKFTILDEEANGCNSTESSEEAQCGDVECSLKNEGLLEGGKIIEDKVKTYLDGIAKENPKEKHIIDQVKAMCLDGQYAKYPPNDYCIALKFILCLYTNIMMECNSWKDTNVCKEASVNAKECKEEAKSPLKVVKLL